jgi:hypothetical protein
MPGCLDSIIVLVDADVHIAASYMNDDKILQKERVYTIRRIGHWNGRKPQSTDIVAFFSDDCIVGMGTVTGSSNTTFDVMTHTVWDYGCVDRTVVYGAWKHAHWNGRLNDAPPRNSIPALFHDGLYTNRQFTAGLQALVDDDDSDHKYTTTIECTPPRITIVL